MGCSSSQSAKLAPENQTLESSNHTYPPSTAFEIPLNDNDESLVRKHPPERLRRLEEAPSTPVSIEKLQEKLANADLRRQQILQQRIANGAKMNADGRNEDGYDGNENEIVQRENDLNKIR